MENGLRLLSKVLRQVATSERFTSYADLKVAFRRQLVALGIRYQQHEFDDVFAIVGSNVRLVADPPVPRAVEAKPDRGEAFNRREARALFLRVTKFGQPKTMPAARTTSPDKLAAIYGPIDIDAPAPRESWGEHDRF